MKRLFTLSFCCVLLNFAYAQCFDMTDLYSSQVVCTYGDYYNPYAYVGVAYERHTVMTNPSAVDPIVGMLKTIPAGEKASIRLGNSDTGAEAESITFSYTVEEDNPILLLKYAAVMENPKHPAEEQPRLKLEVLDQYNTLIDPECTSFDFVSSISLGWNTLDGGSTLWKDWTNVAVDMSEYIGRTVKIRLTNYDCAKSGHFGYAYIFLDCMAKKITSDKCGEISSVTFSAPNGFDYDWYTLDQAGARVSVGKKQSVTVNMDRKEYFCDISQIGKPACHFTMSVIAEPQFPIADFDIRIVESCVDTIYLTNLSGISLDGITKKDPLVPCEEAVWNLGDGRVIYDYDIEDTPIVFADGGSHTITLTVKLNGGACESSISKTVYASGYRDEHIAYLFDTICQGETYWFNSQQITKGGIYTKHTPTAKGCDSSTVLQLTVHPSYLFEFTAQKCDFEKYDFRGIQCDESGIYYDSLKTIHGCDSVFKLDLTSSPVLRDSTSLNICLGDTVFFHNKYYSSTQVVYDTTSLSDKDGCGIHILNLKVTTPSVVAGVDLPAVCANDALYSMIVRYKGTRPLVYSLFYDEKALQQGFVNVIKQPYSDTIFDNIPIFQTPTTYVRPDHYNVRLELDNGICDVQPYNIDMLVRYPSWIIEQNWDDVVALLNEKYNGGYQFSTYQWLVNNRVIDAVTSSNLYMQELTVGDEVVLMLTRINEDYAIPTCPITISEYHDPQNTKPAKSYFENGKLILITNGRKISLLGQIIE